MADNNVNIQISTDVSQAEAGLRTITRSMNDLGGQARDLASPINSLQTALSVGIGGGLSLMVKSAIDAGLQMDRLGKLFTAAAGSSSLAAREMEYIRETSNRLGLDMQTAAQSYGKFMAAVKGTTVEGEAGRKVFEAVSKASNALGLSADETSGVFNALQQMMSKGKVQAEELRGQLGERLPVAFKMAADAMGITTAELDKQLKDGTVLADDLLPKLAVELEKTYGQSAAESAKSASSEINRLNNAMFETKSAAGQALMPVFTDIVRALKPAIELLGSFIGGLQILSVKLASMPDKVAAIYKYIRTGDTAGYKAAMADITNNQDSVIDDLMKRYLSPGSGYTPAEIASQKGNKPSSTPAEIASQKGNKPSSTLAAAKAAQEKKNYTEHSPGFMNWRAEQEMLKQESEWIKKVEKEKSDAAAQEQKDREELGRQMSEIYQLELQDQAKVAAGQKALIDIERLRLEMTMSEVDQQERLNKITSGEAAGRRVELLRKQLDLETGIYDAIKEQSPQADLLRLQELQKIQEINNKLEEQKRLLEDSTWLGAARNGFNEYARSAMDAGAQIKSAIENAFKGMETALFNFVKTGKLSFKDLLTSIGDDITKMLIKTQITGPLSNMLGGLATSIMGGGSSGLGSLGSLAGSLGMKYALGGGTSTAAGFTGYGTTALSPAASLYAAPAAGGSATAGLMSTLGAYAGAGAASYAYLNTLFGSGGTWNSSTGGQKAARGIAYGSIMGAPLGLIDSFTGGGLFGTKWQTKTSGLDIGLSGGGVNASSWAYQEKKKALFGGTSGQFLSSGVSPEATDAFNALWGEITKGITAGAKNLGIDVADALANLDLGSTRIFGDSNSIDKLFAEMGEKALMKVLPDLELLAVAGESASQTLARLNSAFADYQQVMFSDTEIRARQTADTMAAANQVFGDLNLAVPQTKEAFRALFDQLAGQGDLSGMAALMNISGAMREMFDAAAAAANQLESFNDSLSARQLKVGGQNSAADYYAMITGQEAELTKAREAGMEVGLLQQIQERERTKWLQDNYQQAADNYYATQQKQVEVTIQSNASMVASYQATADAFRGVADTLAKTRLSLMTGGLSALSPGDQLRAAKAAMMGDYARGMAGDAGAMQSFAGQAQNYLQSARGYYASSPQYASEYQNVMDMLKNGENMANSKVSDASAQISILSQINTSAASTQQLQQENNAVQQAQLKALMEGFLQLIQLTQDSKGSLEAIESGLERQAAAA